jgi:hypothetical protein
MQYQFKYDEFLLLSRGGRGGRSLRHRPVERPIVPERQPRQWRGRRLRRRGAQAPARHLRAV